jgi:hypothetical protein
LFSTTCRKALILLASFTVYSFACVYCFHPDITEFLGLWTVWTVSKTAKLVLS